MQRHRDSGGFLREYPEYDSRKNPQLQVKKNSGDKEVIPPKKKKRGRPRKQRTIAKEFNSNGDGRLINPLQIHFAKIAPFVLMSSRFFQRCI